LGTDALSGTDGLFVPVSDGKASLAVLAVRPDSRLPLSTEQRKDLEALGNLAALAMTRMHLATEAAQAKWLAESEKLHRALLNAVSHDLRTPLSSITGAVTELLVEGRRYDVETSGELLSTIKEGPNV